MGVAQLDQFLTENANMIIRILCLLLALVLVGCDSQDADWEEAQEKDTITAYEAFAEAYPESPEAEQAQSRIETLRAEQAWTEARQRNTLEAYRGFVEAHPEADMVDEARTRLETLERETTWQDLADSDDVAALRAFATDYADSREAELARERIRELEAQAEAERREREQAAEQEREAERQRQARREAEQATHRVQLAALGSQDQADRGIEMLQQRLSEQLGDVNLEVQQSNGLYLLVTQPMSQDMAEQLCETFKQRDQDCLVRAR